MLALSGDAKPGTRDEVMTLGADAFLTKPVDSVEMILWVEHLLELRAIVAHLPIPNWPPGAASIAPRRCNDSRMSSGRERSSSPASVTSCARPSPPCWDRVAGLRWRWARIQRFPALGAFSSPRLGLQTSTGPERDELPIPPVAVLVAATRDGCDPWLSDDIRACRRGHTRRERLDSSSASDRGNRDTLS